MDRFHEGEGLVPKITLFVIKSVDILEMGGGAELEIVVELGNLVPRKNLGSQKVFLILRYLQS